MTLTVYKCTLRVNESDSISVIIHTSRFSYTAFDFSMGVDYFAYGFAGFVKVPNSEENQISHTSAAVQKII